MELFNKRFVHFMWDDSLKGKEGFTADNIGFLRYAVNDNVDRSRHRVCDSKLSSFPFYSELDGSRWKFFYYDPLYAYKKAFEDGKRVQFRLPGGSWLDIETETRKWSGRFEYRIVEDEEAAEQRVTRAQLSEWLAKGNGVYRTAPDGTSCTVHEFNEENADDPADLCVEVRRWEDKEWHEPIVAYCFPETASSAQDGIGG